MIYKVTGSVAFCYLRNLYKINFRNRISAGKSLGLRRYAELRMKKSLGFLYGRVSNLWNQRNLCETF